jgi:regulator of sigma E protease
MNFSDVLEMMSGGVPFYVAAFIIVLSLLVFVHEWGHYIVARMCGVRVEMFSIGFGKELFGRYDKNGTRWKVCMIPLGGYVKLFGDVDPASAGHDENVKDGEEIRPMSEAERKEAFFSQSVLKRSAVVIAGPAINYIFAFILMVGLFAFNGQPITPPVAAAVVGGSSADKSGFQPHDVIISIDDKPIASFEDVRREMMIALDTKKHFVVERDGELVDIFATPDKVTSEDRFGFKQSRGLLGLISPRHAIRIDTIASIDGQTFGEDEGAAKRAAIAARFDKTFTIETPKKDGEMDTLTIHPVKEYNMFMEQEDSERYGILFVSNIDASVFVKHGFVRSSAEAGKQVWVVTRGTLEALGQMITGTRSATELGGIIRIGALAGDMAKQGLVALIMFTALLSINLGLVNMFPIPMLDGGHLMFYFFEALRGKPVPEHVQEYAFRIGLVFLVGIMAFANLNDIMQLIL